MTDDTDTEAQTKLLSKIRADLLNKVHRKEKQIDCLDYLAYRLQKGTAE